MYLSTFIVALAGLITFAVGAPLETDPTSTVNPDVLTASHTATPFNVPTDMPSTPLVNVTFFLDDNCGKKDWADGHVYDTECKELSDGWHGLVVEKADPSLTYNSLRVFKSSDCSGPWTLEPIKCAAEDGGGGCACSHISTYHSDSFPRSSLYPYLCLLLTILSQTRLLLLIPYSHPFSSPLLYTLSQFSFHHTPTPTKHSKKHQHNAYPSPHHHLHRYLHHPRLGAPAPNTIPTFSAVDIGIDTDIDATIPPAPHTQTIDLLPIDATQPDTGPDAKPSGTIYITLDVFTDNACNDRSGPGKYGQEFITTPYCKDIPFEHKSAQVVQARSELADDALRFYAEPGFFCYKQMAVVVPIKCPTTANGTLDCACVDMERFRSVKMEY
ncbi:hypothetical protein CC80DRAFT_559433 [Byssothecium circinans]|uniref:Uncharacterized protein n=1 Tax=Byssothecium circinans TaxID=147558 RepID=A0A6A5U2A8_9PLEO|nr:hypothetical protein CC80DRAFT_559433 [Byssothecium circinans]